MKKPLNLLVRASRPFGLAFLLLSLGTNQGWAVKTEFQRSVAGITTEQQQKKIEISGTVADENGDPVIGATVSEKGTTNGVIVDLNGHYNISVPVNAKLEIRYIGYNSEERTVKNAGIINITLLSSSVNLEDVVVVGYGSQRKVNLTGAIVSTSGEVLKKYSSPNPASTLQGILPGLQVTQGSGRPGGENVKLQIRGMGSYGSGNDPLIIVDGIPGGMPTSENIETVTVLKDAASAAIYGSRAANGVILITTKRGKAGQTSVEYSVNYGLYQASKLPDVITNSADFMALWNQAAIHSNSPGEQYEQADIEKYRNANGDPKYPNTNWMDLVFRNACVANHSLTITGGGEKTTYNLNLNYLSQPGIMVGTDFSRYTARLNVESKISSWLKAGVNASFGYNESKGVNEVYGDVFSAAFRQSPTYGAYRPGDPSKMVRFAFPTIEYKNASNPFTMIDGSNNKTTGTSFQINPYLNVKFADWLTWDINASFSSGWSKNKSFSEKVSMYNWTSGELAQEVDAGGFAGLKVSDNNSISPLIFSTLNFSKKIGNHYVGALAGIQMEYSKNESLSAYRKTYLSNLTQEIDAGDLDGIQNSGTASEYAMISYFGRLNYSYKDKYLCEFNLRADGSSRFAKDNRWGYFPSGSIGWRPFQESFIPKIKFIDDFKIRGSYGVLGNQGNDNYPYENVIASGDRLFYSYDNKTIVSGMAPVGLVNKNISWETTKVFDVGFDINMFNNKLLFTFDWFKKNTTDILRKQQVTYESGYPLASPYINSGSMQNKGFEFSAEYRGNVNDFNYAVNWNIQTYKNKVTSFGVDEINADPYSPTIIREGEPYKSYYIYTWDGIFQTQAEADASGQSNSPKAGDLKIKDLDKNGIIDGNDKSIKDGVFPKCTSGLRLSASYKNFDFSAFFYGSFGTKVYVYGDGLEPFYQGSVPTKDWLNAWTPENHSTTMPAVYNSQRYNSTWTTYPNTWYLRDNSFVRLKNLNIGYTLDLATFTKQIVKSIRVYVSGENLLTFTSYDGLDPERNGFGNYLTYPQNRVFSIGASVKF
ncbi:MAG: TonB-dependent receptor [Bacteroidaceae bacterium]